MWYITPLVIIVVGLWLGRGYLKGLILKLKEKKEVQKVVKKDFVYTPVLSSRTFNFAIEISEVGEGKASIKVINTKGLQD